MNHFEWYDADDPPKKDGEYLCWCHREGEEHSKYYHLGVYRKNKWVQEWYPGDIVIY